MLKRITRVVERIRRPGRIVDRPLTTAERSFVEANRSFWTDLTGHASPSGAGCVVVEVPQSPFLLHYVAALGRLAAEARGLRLVALPLPNTTVDRGMAEVLASYGVETVLRTPARRYLTHVWNARKRAQACFETLRTPDDVLYLEIDGVPVGDLIYDSILRGGFATLDRVDERVLAKLRTFFIHRAMIEDVLDGHDVRFGVFSHHIGINAGVFVRQMLARRIPVVHAQCMRGTVLRVHRGLDDAYAYALRMEDRYVQYLFDQHRTEIEARGATYLRNRMRGEVMNRDQDAQHAFGRGDTIEDRDSFAARVGLPAGRKNVFVMLHAFNDHPHMFGRDAILHGDYYRWFMESLRIARSEPDVNFIFKEHPVAALYTTNDLDLHDVFRDVDEPNVCFLDRNADFNARSLLHLADAVVTCVGSAGLEYAAVGIPSLLGGKGPYSGFGFTYEPETEAAYEAMLRGAPSLAPPDDDQQAMARIVLYAQRQIARNDLFFLNVPYESVDTMRSVSSDQLWADTAAHLGALDVEATRRTVEKLTAFLRRDDVSQYVDLDRFPFMRPVVDGVVETET